MAKQRSQKHIRILIAAVALLLLTAAFIFFMSSRNVDQSMEDSMGFDRMLAGWFVEDFDQMSPAEQEAAAMVYDEPIRHVAHTAEFFALGALLAMVCSLTGLPLPAGWAAGTAYGVLDEIHQIFVYGRGCQISDMCFDAFGVLLGVLAAAAVRRAMRMKRRTRE